MLSFIPSLAKESLYHHKGNEHMEIAYDLSNRFDFQRRQLGVSSPSPHSIPPSSTLKEKQRSRRTGHKCSYHGKMSRFTGEAECVMWVIAAISVEKNGDPHIRGNYGCASRQTYSLNYIALLIWSFQCSCFLPCSLLLY